MLNTTNISYDILMLSIFFLFLLHNCKTLDYEKENSYW